MIYSCLNFYLNLLLDMLLVFFFRIHSVAFYTSSSTFIFSTAINSREICLFLLRAWTIVAFWFLFFWLNWLRLFFLFLVDPWVIWGWGRWWKSFFIRNNTFILTWFFFFLSLYIFQWLYFVNMFFRELILYINRLWFLLVHLIEHFVHLWIIFKSICISKCIQTVICWGGSWRNTSNHHNFWLTNLLRYERIS